MLSNLLPGLRDVRVPLTVGYFWLFNAWIWFSGCLPSSAPSGDGAVAQAYELGETLGRVAVVGALSFLAYLLGTLLQIPLQLPVPPWAQRALLVESTDSRGTRLDYQSFLSNLEMRIESKMSGFSPDQYEEVSGEAAKAAGATVDELRPRLLVANQELFSEYDRLASEAQFRTNVCPPLLALGITAAITVAWWWIIPASVACYGLMSQGLRKRAESVSVIQRAVLSNIIVHPLQSILNRWGSSS